MYIAHHVALGYSPDSVMPVKRLRSESPACASALSKGDGSTAQTSDVRDRSGWETHRQRRRTPHPIGDIFDYQELFLRILSFLSPTELASIQGVNRYWSRMSTDPQVITRLSKCNIADSSYGNACISVRLPNYARPDRADVRPISPPTSFPACLQERR